MGGSFDDRRRALEDAFYPEAATDSRERLRLREREAAAVPALREASGITDESILRRLAGLGIRAETLAALTMIPIVEVAWADGEVDERERAAILAGAEAVGIDPGSPSHSLLHLWTLDAPPPELTRLWREFIAALARELEPEERDRLRERIVGRARSVARAAGGFLGVGSISPDEERVLAALERSFVPAG